MLGAKFEQYYDTLKLNYQDMEALTKEERLGKIKKAYRRLALLFHPDKHPGNEQEATQMFKAINEANEVLTNKKPADFHHQFDSKHQSKAFDLNGHEFDLRMAQAFRDYHATIIDKLEKIQNPDLKAAAEAYYGDFIDLAESINLTDYATTAGEQLIGQLHSFSKTWFYRWRMLMMKLFAEERLSDFEYREMLAFGLDLDHMPWRKLVIPVKWMAAATILLSTTLISAYNYTFNNAFILAYQSYNELQHEYDNFTNGYPVNYTRSLGIVVGLTLFALFILSPYFSYAFTLYGVGLLLEKLSLAIAAPVNTLLRPLWQMMVDHPTAATLSIASALVVALSTWALIATVPAFAAFISSITLTHLIAVGVGALDLAVMALLPYYLYNIYPDIAIFLGSMNATQLALVLIVDYTLLTSAYMAIASNPLSLFVFAATQCGLIEGLRVMSDPQAHQEAIFERVPLPESKVDNEVK